MIRVFILTPVRYWRGPEHLAADLPEIGAALKEIATRKDEPFASEARKYEFEFAACVGGLCRARIGGVTEALKGGADFILWTDDDLRPEGMTLAEAWLRLLSHRQPVVGALYCKRERDARRPRWSANFIAAATLQKESDGLLQVAELAIGLKCYHRKIFEETARLFGDEPLQQTPKGASIKYRDRDTGESLYGWFQNVVNDGDLLSEDFFLDYLCRCAKIGILADTRIKCRQVSKDGKGVYPEGAFPPIPAKIETT